MQINSSCNELPDDGCALEDGCGLSSIAQTCHIFHINTMKSVSQPKVQKVSSESNNPDLREWRPYMDGLTTCGAGMINSTIIRVSNYNTILCYSY